MRYQLNFQKFFFSGIAVIFMAVVVFLRWRLLDLPLERDGGDIEEALSHYRQAISLYPGFAKAHNNIGSTIARQGKFTKAIAYFEKAINIDPSYMDARKNLELARSLSK